MVWKMSAGPPFFFLWLYRFSALIVPSGVECLLGRGAVWSFASRPASLMAANDKRNRWPRCILYRAESCYSNPGQLVCRHRPEKKNHHQVKVPYCKLAVLLQSKTGAAKRMQLCHCLCRLITKQSLLDYRRASSLFVCFAFFFYVVSHNACISIASMQLLSSSAWWITLMALNPCFTSCQLCSRCLASSLLLHVKMLVLTCMCSRHRNVSAAALQKLCSLILYVSAELQFNFYTAMLSVDVCGKDVTVAQE